MTVTIHHSGDGTTVDGTARGDGSAAILKGAGFRWGRSITAWYLPRPWSYDTRARYVTLAADQLRAAGFAVEVDDQGPGLTTTATERREAQAERSEVRAERLTERAGNLEAAADELHDRAHTMADAIPFGQPILVGHYSERADRNYRARVERTFVRGIETQRAADETERRAKAAAAAQRHRESAPATLRRIERNETTVRKIERSLSRPLGDHPGAPAWAERMRVEAARLVDEIAADREHVATLEAAGVKLWGPADFQRGDLVKYWGGWRTVVRVNPKSLSVQTAYTWTDKVPYDKVTGREPAGGTIAQAVAAAETSTP